MKEKIKMIRKKISLWWHRERVGRFEEGTSQDMCPTNGDAVVFASVMLCPTLIILISFIFG